MLINGLASTLLFLTTVVGAEPPAAPGVTSLTNRSVTFTTPTEHYVEIRRGPVRIVIADNEAIDAPTLRGHRAGYNGVALLAHAKRSDNLSVPSVAGLNFEQLGKPTAS